MECKLIMEGEELAKAIKNAGVIGTATYLLNYNKEKFTLSSTNFHDTESFKTEINLIHHEGEEATVEFSAPLDKFSNKIMTLYLRDDSPVILHGIDRCLIVAPYVRGR